MWTATDYPELLTVDELAARLRIGRSTAYVLCREPGFPAVRVRGQIRILAAELASWLNNTRDHVTMGNTT